MSIFKKDARKKTARPVRFLFAAFIVSVFAGFLGTGIAWATVPVPSGFYNILSDTGINVYRKDYAGGKPDFVTIVDLRYGTLRNFTGSVSGSNVERRLLRTHWDNAVAQNTGTRTARVAINGTFFSTNSSPYTGIAFGLKADRWIMSYGYNPAEQGPNTALTFAYDNDFGSSSIQPYSTGTFSSNIPNVIGGLVPNCCKSPNSYTQRTLVGVRDDNGDGHSETVIFFSSAYSTQPGAVSVLQGFGAGSKMLLDGGGSTGLIIDGNDVINPENRTIPQAFIICKGK